MSVLNIKSADPLYIIILKNPQAESLLKSWVKDNRIEHVIVNGNRMMIHNQNAFNRFILSWVHDWNLVTIWDTWNRRHIYI